jgi:hypothetical protein
MLEREEQALDGILAIRRYEIRDKREACSKAICRVACCGEYLPWKFPAALPQRNFTLATSQLQVQEQDIVTSKWCII